MVMARHQFVVQDEAGNIVTDAHVEVRRELPGAPLAMLFEDRDGAVPLGNPFDAAADGTAFFHAAGGSYRIRVYTGLTGVPTTERIMRYVPVGLNSEADGFGVRSSRVVTTAGDVDVAADDVDDIVIQKDVAATTTVTLPSAAGRTRSVRIVDGKGDAGTNNITIIPAAGETIYATVDYPAVIDGNGGSLTLTPRADGTGWY